MAAGGTAVGLRRSRCPRIASAKGMPNRRPEAAPAARGHHKPVQRQAESRHAVGLRRRMAEAGKSQNRRHRPGEHRDHLWRHQGRRRSGHRRGSQRRAIGRHRKSICSEDIRQERRRTRNRSPSDGLRMHCHGTHSNRKPVQDLLPRRSRRARAQGSFGHDPAGRDGRADGRVGLRQVDADEHPRPC